MRQYCSGGCLSRPPFCTAAADFNSGTPVLLRSTRLAVQRIFGHVQTPRRRSRQWTFLTIEMSVMPNDEGSILYLAAQGCESFGGPQKLFLLKTGLEGGCLFELRGCYLP
jgi:hypothetical protein